MEEQRKKILIVDDSEMNREILVSMLEDEYMPMKKKQELMKDLREKERQQKKRPEERLRFLQSHPARPELHIRIWRLKELKKLQKQKTVQ